MADHSSAIAGEPHQLRANIADELDASERPDARSHYCVSVTGFRPNGIWQLPKFWLRTIRALTQAQQAKGCVFVTARTIGEIYHTMTVWTDGRHIRTYVTTGCHQEAMRGFRSLGTGRVYTFETDHVPAWEEAYIVWTKFSRKA